MGLHVLYSGTVGAAREAACKDRRGMAFSLNNFRASTVEDFAPAAASCVHLIKAALGLVHGSATLPDAMRGNVVNVNLPFTAGAPAAVPPQGYYLAHMGKSCLIPSFKVGGNRETALQRLGLPDDEDHCLVVMASSSFQKDDAFGSDSWAIGHGWVSVTPLGLMQDYALSKEHLMRGREFVASTAELVQAAAKSAGVASGGTDLAKL